MKTVLIIEDNKEIRENTAELLELEGYNVVTAQNGDNGFEAAKAIIPDVVLCDVMMPEGDGMSFLKRIKCNVITSAIPLVFFSADIAMEKVFSLQGCGFISKPFSEQALIAAINAVFCR